MIVKKDFLSKLKDFGLNSYESKLWTALLSRGISTAGELSDIANVPRSRSYDVLESLEKKGFIIMKLGKPIKYVAVPPEEVVERVKKRIDEETKEQIKLLEDVKDSEVLKELQLLHKQGLDLVDPNDFSGAIKGRNNIYEHLDAMISSAKKSITMLTTPDGLVRKIDAFKKTLQKAKDNGVKIRIGVSQGKGAQAVQKPTKDLKSVAELRSTNLKGRFVIVDGKQVVFMPVSDAEVHPTYDVGIWISTEFFASTMEEMFDGVWKDSERLE